MNLILHPSTAILVQRLEQHLPQSLLLSGDAGVGLRTIAEHLAGADTLAVIEPTDSKDNVDHNRGTIGIEPIRRLYEQTRARQTRRQIVIIDDADRMSHGAQNAFLKLLEEPNEYIYFILTAHRPKQLLPTIRSRVQTVNILPVHDDQTANILHQLGVNDAKKRAQLTFIAAGLPAKLARLVVNDDYFADEAKAMGDARMFLQGTTFEKLALISTYAASREKAIQLIDSSLMIVRRSLSGNPEPRFVHQLERLLSAREAIDANHHIKLQLARIVL